jgi:hypothetical protein
MRALACGIGVLVTSVLAAASPARTPVPPHLAATAVRTLSYELAFGEGSPYAKRFPSLPSLGYRRSREISRRVLDRIVGIATAETGTKQVAVTYGPGGWKDAPVQPSAQLDVLGTEASTLQAMRIIGYLAQQTMVIASRPTPSGKVGALEISHEGERLARHERVQRYWHDLGTRSPDLFQGFLPLRRGGRSGLRIMDTGGLWSQGEYPAFERAIRETALRHGLQPKVTRLRVEVLDVSNDWKKHPTGAQYLNRIAGATAPRLRKRLVYRYEPEVRGWISSAFAATAPRPVPASVN